MEKRNTKQVFSSTQLQKHLIHKIKPLNTENRLTYFHEHIIS